MQTSQRAARDYTLGEALKTWQWWVLWLLLFLNTSAGISVISQEAPLFRSLAAVTVTLRREWLASRPWGTPWGGYFGPGFQTSPLLIAHLRESTGVYGGALHIIAVVLLLSIILPFIVRPPRVA